MKFLFIRTSFNMNVMNFNVKHVMHEIIAIYHTHHKVVIKLQHVELDKDN